MSEIKEGALATARARVSRTQVVLLAGVVTSALFWALAAATLALGALVGLDWWVGLTSQVRVLLRPFAAFIGAAAAVVVAWRGRGARSPERVALWIEEAAPRLRYALVTVLEGRFAAAAPRLEEEVAAVSWWRPLVRAALRATLVPAAALALGVLALAALPRGAVERVGAPRPGDALLRPGPRGGPADPLSPLVATVVSPAYARLAPVTLEDPDQIAALAGSAVRIEGRGDARRLHGRLGADTPASGPGGGRIGGDTLTFAAGGGRWRAGFVMPAEPAALVLTAEGRERVVVLAPQPDSVPVVTLSAPARDTIFRAATGVLPLAAEARDDIGLDAAWFELIVSAGEGETFTFRTAVVHRTAAGGARALALRATLRLDSLGLAPGNIVHLRAVAADGNTVAGPGKGVSETRTLRIARVGEYDSIALEGAPPLFADTSLLSQRMLLMLAEALEARRPRMERPPFVDESRRIASDQARLRRRVGDVIFMRLGGAPQGEEGEGEGERRGGLSPEELLRAADSVTTMTMGEALDFAGGESPVVAVNRPLLEAYNAMWDAGRELEIGEPGRAIPHMRAALEAIQRARNAVRVYLRGRAAPLVVDVARVRLAGSREGAGGGRRAPRPALTLARGRLLSRFRTALPLLAARDPAAVDSLLLLRVDALGGAPAAAAALGEAIAALRAGRDATAPLVRARRALEAEPLRGGPLAAWEGGW